MLAARPATLTASATPVLLGSILAAQAVRLDWVLFVLSLAGAVLIQVGTNLADEYTDHRKSGSSGKFPAPHKVIQRGLLSEQAVLVGLVVCFALSTGIGLFIVSQVGWPILVVGVVSLLVGYVYSSGPFPLGNWALGEVIVFTFMGPVIVMASYYVQIPELTWPLFWASVPVGLLVVAILQVNNLRDIDEDRVEGKYTLASIFGRRRAQWMYTALVLGAYLTLVSGVVMGVLPTLALMGLVSLPWALVYIRRLLLATERQMFNRILLGTAGLHMWTVLFMSLGLALEVLVE